jgi:hypothetical protein
MSREVAPSSRTGATSRKSPSRYSEGKMQIGLINLHEQWFLCCSVCTYCVMLGNTQLGSVLIRDRCYDHNFLRFLTIFCEKIGVFLKKQCYDQFFISFVFSQKRQFFAEFFGENIFKNHNIGPWSLGVARHRATQKTMFV